MLWLFGLEAYGSLAPQPGSEPVPPALEGEVPTTRLPRKSHVYFFLILVVVSSDQIRSVVSDSLQPHESQHARPPCPSPTPGVH